MRQPTVASATKFLLGRLLCRPTYVTGKTVSFPITAKPTSTTRTSVTTSESILSQKLTRFTNFARRSLQYENSFRKRPTGDVMRVLFALSMQSVDKVFFIRILIVEWGASPPNPPAVRKQLPLLPLSSVVRCICLRTEDPTLQISYPDSML